MKILFCESIEKFKDAVVVEDFKKEGPFKDITIYNGSPYEKVGEIAENTELFMRVKKVTPELRGSLEEMRRKANILVSQVKFLTMICELPELQEVKPFPGLKAVDGTCACNDGACQEEKGETNNG